MKTRYEKDSSLLFTMLHVKIFGASIVRFGNVMETHKER